MFSRERLKQHFGQRVRFFREEKDLSQQTLAEKVGVTASAVSQWETGHKLPDGEHLLNLHEALDVPIARLFETPEDKLEGVVQVFVDQTESNDPIRDFIRQNKPSALFLIQYVSVNIMEVINTFRRYAPPEKSPQIFLLIKYPGTKKVDAQTALSLKEQGIHVVAPFQFTKVRTQLQSLLESDTQPDSPKLHVRCYHAPGSMRAAYIGYPLGESLRAFLPKEAAPQADTNVGLLSMSQSRYTGQEGGVIGHLNPLIHIHSNTKNGKILCKFFETTFLELWNDSREGEVVLQEMKDNE